MSLLQLRFARSFITSLMLLGALGGCAMFSFDKHDSSNTKNHVDASATEAKKTNTAFDIRVESENSDIHKMVERHNDLQLYRCIDDLDATELKRLLVLTEHDVRNLVSTEGYFAPKIQVSIENPDAEKPTVLIDIDPGEATTIEQVTIDFEGDIATSEDSDTQKQQKRIRSDWSLRNEQRFTQNQWSSAKTLALAELVERRYPKGNISYSVADVDAVTARAKLTVRLDSGAPYHLGAASVQGAKRYPPELAERLSWLRPDDVYDQKRIVEAQQRLTGSGYYDSAWIAIDVEKGDPEAVPVRYFVKESKRHKLETGIGYSTDNGPRMTLEHRDNTFFGTSWRSETKLHLNRKEPLLALELTSLPNASGWRKSGLARYMRQDDGILKTTSRTLQAGLAKSTERHDYHWYTELVHATVTGSGDRQVPSARLGDGAAVSANFAWAGRYFNELPTATRGYGLAAEMGLGMTLQGEKKPFGRLRGRWLGLMPISKKMGRLQLRAEGGAVVADDAARVPGVYMFRTGGDTTVRGYRYRRIGVNVGDDLIGPGRFMSLGSVEWQRPIFQERFPGLLEHVLFIDVGSVANHVRDLNARWGVGTGLRLITPVGPMEIDLAYGLKTKDLRLHMIVGFVF